MPGLLSQTEIKTLLSSLHHDWQPDNNGRSITYDFQFKNFHETMAFVNAVAWIAHHMDHHPDLEVGYKHCLIRYSTHSINGLSTMDFDAALKIEALLS